MSKIPATSANSLSEIRMDELKKELISLIQDEFIDFHVGISKGGNFTIGEHYDLVKRLFILEKIIESA